MRSWWPRQRGEFKPGGARTANHEVGEQHLKNSLRKAALTPPKALVPHRMKSEIRIVIILVVVTISTSNTVAQQPPAKCPQVEYSARMTNAYPYRLTGIEGQAVYGAASERGELQSASAVCVALFDQKDEHLVANVTTESGGQFNFANVPPGKYVLILSLSALHEIIIPVEVGHSRKGRTFKRWGLLLHLRSREDRKRSFVTPITNLGLREELLKMEREDQAIRNEIIKYGYNLHDLTRQALDARMAVIDSGNTARMKEIVKKYGWPGPGLVGGDGAYAAFLLVQHSPDLALQKAILPLVRRSYKAGNLSAWSYALLQDRVLVREGKSQMYGTTLDHWAAEGPAPAPLEDEAAVDKRRAKIGLPPLREYRELMKRLYFPQGNPKK
jgi:hypothetical protein